MKHVEHEFSSKSRDTGAMLRLALGAGLALFSLTLVPPCAVAGVDVTPPTCEILSYNPNTGVFTVEADDDLEICYLELSSNQQNLILNDPLDGCDFSPPVSFTVDVVNQNLPASGNIIVEDGNYNSVTDDRCRIDLPVSHPAESSPGGWGEDIATQIINGENLFGYLASGEAGVHVYDVSNPGAVSFESTLTPGANDCDPVSGYPDFYADAITVLQTGDLPFESAVFPDDVAIVAMGACGVMGFNISNPGSISQAFHFKPPSWTEAVDTFIDSEEETIYVYAATFWGGLKIYGQTNPINNPAAFGLLGTWGVNDPAIGPAIDLDAEFRDGMILVHVLTDVGMRTVDVTNPTAPVEIGSFEFAPTELESGEGMAIVGNRAFVALWQGGLLMLDISDPMNPTEVPNSRIPTDPGTAYYSVTTNGAGTRLYAAEGWYGLRTFWINPDMLEEQAPSPIDVGDGAWAWALAERDRIVYVPYGILGNPATGGFQIFEYNGDPCGDGFEQSLVLPLFVYWSVRRKRRKNA